MKVCVQGSAVDNVTTDDIKIYRTQVLKSGPKTFSSVELCSESETEAELLRKMYNNGVIIGAITIVPDGTVRLIFIRDM